MENNLLLKEVISRIQQEKKLPVVVFDLDDTLFSTARRNLMIIQNFCADQGHLFPDFAKTASTLSLQDMNWSVKFALTNAGLDQHSPSLTPFIAYWDATFYTDFYVSLDLPNPGAVAFVNACHDAGALVYYLTGRHVSEPGLNNGMGQGTARSLIDRGFPFFTGGCELNLKAHSQEPDTAYKQRALNHIKSLQGEVIGTFDNEPSNAVMFLSNFPKAMNFWVKTTWNPNDQASTKGLHVITSFLE